MTFEVELKARVTDPAAVEAQAARLGDFAGEVRKEDVYFRAVGDSSPLPAKRYRLRRSGERAVVTFKQAVQAGGVEVNDEVEFEVDDARAFFRFAHHLGFEPFVLKSKRTRLYRVGRAAIELNEVKHLGHFVEIEILCEAQSDVFAAQVEIHRLLTRLGLSEADLEPRRYITLIQEAHPVSYRYRPDDPSDWPFAEEPGSPLKIS